MDQVRTILGWIKRQHFWLLLGLVALIAVGCWWKAAGTLLAKFNANKATITAGFTEIDGVKNTVFHPNQAIIDQQTKENAGQEKSVHDLWQVLYQKQQNGVLKWPAALSPAFRADVEKKKFGDPIPEDLRDNYQNYIEQHFPELPKEIGAQPIDISASTPGMGGGEYSRGPGAYGPVGVPGMPGVPVDDDYICEWAPADQQVIRDELNFPQRPSALRIWVTQEDLWVYHTLLNVIAKTNQAVNATRKSNAAIRSVVSIEVGQRAAPYSRTPGRLLVQPAVAAAAGADGAAAGAAAMAPGGGDGRSMAPGMMPEGGTAGGPISPAVEQGMLMFNRYIDDKGQPIAAGGGGGGDAGAAAPAPDAAAPAGDAPPLDMNQFGAGYKRLPVRLVMQMDVRRLPILIAACANEPLRVEVQEVRINPADAAGAGGGMMSGMMGGYRGGGERGPGAVRGPMGEGGPGPRAGGMGMGMGMGSGGPAASLFQDRGGAIQAFSARPYETTVVVQGIIYIFNKPNLNNSAPAAAQTAAAPAN